MSWVPSGLGAAERIASSITFESTESSDPISAPRGSSRESAMRARAGSTDTTRTVSF